MYRHSLSFLIIYILSLSILTSCSYNKTENKGFNKVQKKTSFSYLLDIDRICYVYLDEQNMQNRPFRNSSPQSRSESSYLINFSIDPNTQFTTVSIVRQNNKRKTNDIPEELNVLKDRVIESELLKRNELEKVETASFNLQQVNETELTIVDLKPESGVYIKEKNLVKEMKYIIDAIFSRDASNIKWLYPLEQSHIRDDAVFESAITLKTDGYDIKVPIWISHNTENSYNKSSGRNEKIFHKIKSLSLQEIKITDTNRNAKFGTITNYILFERYVP